MKSIQTKFMLLILGCVLLAAAVIGGSGVHNAKQTVDRDAAKIMNLLCSEKMQEINGQLSRIEQSVKMLAVYTTNQLESVERLKNDGAYRAHYTEQLETIAINQANNTEGAAAVYIRFSPDLAPPTSGLFWSKTALNGSFERQTPTDFSSYSPTDVEHVGWYYLPVKNGKATWMEPYFNQNIDVYMISYVIPLYRENQVVGVVGMDIDFHLLTESVAKMPIYDSGYGFLANAQGQVMDHPRLPFSANLASKDASLRNLAEELDNGASGSSLFTYRWQNEAKKMAFRTLNNGMRLVITAPVAEIDAAKNALIGRIIWATLFISLIAIVLTFYLTGKVVRPLKELNDAARKIAEGDLSVTITHSTKDEVGDLADSFQKTVNHLQEYITYINTLAYRDALTGVKNKTAYEDMVQRMEERMRFDWPQFAVVVFDLNNLKMVNDQYGHDFGNMLIINACKIICATFQNSPVYRIGGDEFVVLLENSDYAHYPLLLEKLAQNIADFNDSAHMGSKISIARGVAVYNSATDLVFGQVFKRADEAMYQNKATVKAHNQPTSAPDAAHQEHQDF